MPSRGHRGGFGPTMVLPSARAGVPMYEQIYRTVRDAIVRGTIRGGERIASTRALATELAVSRFTVVAAIDRLVAEGYLTTRDRSGVFVADALPEQTMRPPRRMAAGPGKVVTAPGRDPSLARRGVALSSVVITGPRGDEGPRPFHPRRPALDAFPRRIWARLIARRWRSGPLRDLDYGEPGGYAPLRQAIADHISISRGLRCDPRQVIVTSGSQQAFDMLFRILLDPGDHVWMEDPGYLDVRAALVGAGAVLVPVPVRDGGIDVTAGIARASTARLAVVSPSHQYPTGIALSAPRRAALIDWARRAGAWIVEDDYDSYFRYQGRPLPALQRFDRDSAHGLSERAVPHGLSERAVPHGRSERVVYVGTFSKTMFPSLRLGFCIVPDGLVEAATNARAVAGRNGPIVDQAALAAFITDGHYDRHLRRARLIYQERYEAMRDAFRRELAGILTLSAAAAGTHLLAGFDRPDDGRPGAESRAVRVARAAADEGLVIFPLSRYCLEPPQRDALVLGYGGVTPRQIVQGAAKLARVIHRLGR